jgi:hypothetical protein
MKRDTRCEQQPHKCDASDYAVQPKPCGNSRLASTDANASAASSGLFPRPQSRKPILAYTPPHSVSRHANTPYPCMDSSTLHAPISNPISTAAGVWFPSPLAHVSCRSPLQTSRYLERLSVTGRFPKPRDAPSSPLALICACKC